MKYWKVSERMVLKQTKIQVFTRSAQQQVEFEQFKIVRQCVYKYGVRLRNKDLSKNVGLRNMVDLLKPVT